MEEGHYLRLVKPVLALYATHLLGSWLCDFCLAWLAFILLFTVPAVYKKKQAQIDGLWKTVNDKTDHFVNLALAKVPKYSDLKED